MKAIFNSLLTGLLLFALAACSDVPSPYEVYNPGNQGNDSIKTLPYSESFTSSIGDFSIYNVSLEDGLSYVWTFSSNYSCMKASGYVNPINYTSDSWLISPPIDLSGDTAAYLAFEHSTGYLYSNAPSAFMKVKVSKDYTTGDPSAATWSELTVPNWYSGTSFEFVASGDITLSEFVGESNVHIAFQYLSTASTGPTWEVKSLTISSTGSAAPGPDPVDDTVKTLPYTEALTSGMGSFAISNVTLPDGLNYVWSFSANYSCMKASGFYNSANNAAESWLISPAITLKGETAAYLNFEHALYIKDTPANFLKVYVSKDYVTGSPVSSATWNELTIATWPTANYTFVSAGSINLSSYLGEENVHIAFAYTSTGEVALTWEVKNFSVSSDGTGGGGGDTPEPPVGGEGSKTQPYTVSQAQSNQSGNAWVEGYIVGYINGMTLSSGAVFALPTEAQTEILIAADPSCTDYTACLPVQLPAGAIRSSIELYAHPNLLGEKILLYGSLEKYFGAAGMKTVTCAITGGTTYGIDPTGGSGGGDEGGDDDDANAIYKEDFSAGQGAWTTTLLKGTTDWTFTSYNTDYCAKMSAHNSTEAQEAWLVSPEINLSKDCTFSFKVCVGYWNADCLAVYVTDEYDGDVTTAAWERLSFTIPQEPATGFGTFVSAGSVSLASYTGSNVRLAFQYTGDGSASKTTTYEITKIVIK